MRKSRGIYFWRMMTKNRRISKSAGLLILAGMVVGVFSVVPSVDGKEFLAEAYVNRVEVFRGTFFQFLLVPIYAVFSLVMYAALRNYNKTLSVGFLGFRFMAIAFQLIGVLILPVIVLLSQRYLEASSSDLPMYELYGEVVRYLRDLTNHLGVIVATGLGNFFMYAILFKRKLVPKWLSLWGVAGSVVIMVAGFLVAFQCVEVVSVEYGSMAMPLVLQEVILAIWLIGRGLRDQNGGLN